jgi:hypothetical protein
MLLVPRPEPDENSDAGADDQHDQPVGSRLMGLPNIACAMAMELTPNTIQSAT